MYVYVDELCHEISFRIFFVISMLELKKKQHITSHCEWTIIYVLLDSSLRNTL